MLNQIISYFQTDSESYIKYVAEHVTISIEALLIALIAGIPAGYLCFRYRWLKKYIIFIAQGLRVIPGLAVLFILIPLVGVGRLPALIALVFLAVPPILINTNLGLEEIPKVYIESGYGMGMSNKVLIKKILFPLGNQACFGRDNSQCNACSLHRSGGTWFPYYYRIRALQDGFPDYRRRKCGYSINAYNDSI